MIKYREKFTFITFLIIFLIYNFIGYSLNVDTLKVLVFNENKGITISFIGVIIPIIAAYIIYYFTKKLNEKS